MDRRLGSRQPLQLSVRRLLPGKLGHGTRRCWYLGQAGHLPREVVLAGHISQEVSTGKDNSRHDNHGGGRGRDAGRLGPLQRGAIEPEEALWGPMGSEHLFRLAL